MAIDNLSPIAPKGTARHKGGSALADHLIEEVCARTNQHYAQAHGYPPTYIEVRPDYECWYHIVDEVVLALREVLACPDEPVGVTLDGLGGWAEFSGVYRDQPVVVHLLWRVDEDDESVITLERDLTLYTIP